MTAITFALAKIVQVLPRTAITRAVGTLCDLPLPPAVSRLVVGAYARAYDVDLTEAKPLNGSHAYRSFDDFFSRHLRDGARPCTAPPGILVSPSDGRLEAYGGVDPNGKIVVKGRSYRAEDLLVSQSEATRYHGGQFAVIYLSPRDYHRVHAPTAGKLVEIRSAAGELFPVNSIGERYFPEFLVCNRRVALTIDSDALGRVTVVMVAAMVVGRITVTGINDSDVPLGTHRPHLPTVIERGGELGVFHLGSTAVLFVEKNRIEKLDRNLGPIRLGQPLHGHDMRPEVARD